MSKSRHVFVAEDDLQIVNLLRIRLELSGYRVSHARDGVSATRGIMASQPDAVILDIGLPYRDGFEVLREIRRHSMCKAIPVLMLSARHATGDVQQALLCGVQDYVAKPFDDRALLSRLSRLFDARSARTEHQTRYELDS